MVRLLGPAYWDLWFGITDKTAFENEVEPYLPNLTVFGFGVSSKDLADQAWDDPFSAIGLSVFDVLTWKRTVGGSSVPPGEIQSGGNKYSQSLQEQTMGTLIIPNAYQVTIHGSAGSHQVDNVFCLQGASAGDEAAAAAAFQVAWETTSGPLARLCFRYSVIDYTAVDLSTAGGGIAVLTSGATGGTVSVDFATRAASALIKWNGSSRDRTTRGRTYYGPLSEDQVDSDGASLTSTAQSQITTAFNAFRASLNVSGFPLAVASRKDSKATIVTAQTVEITLASQRRRIRS